MKGLLRIKNIVRYKTRCRRGISRTKHGINITACALVCKRPIFSSVPTYTYEVKQLLSYIYYVINHTNHKSKITFAVLQKIGKAIGPHPGDWSA